MTATADAVNPVWVPVTDSERPEVFYHAVSAGRSQEVMERKRDAVLAKGLRPRKSRHKDASRDSQSLVFLFDSVLSAEIFAAGGPIFEVRLAAAAPLYRDTKLTQFGAMFTTVAVSPEALTLLSIRDILDRRFDTPRDAQELEASSSRAGR